MGVLSREAILARDDKPTFRVHVPEWGGAVLIGMLGMDERVAFEQRVRELPPDSHDLVPALLTLTLVDEQGGRLFTDDDIKALSTKAAPVILRLFQAAMHHNRLGDREVTAAQGESEPSR